jgi:hypothetical protein
MSDGCPEPWAIESTSAGGTAEALQREAAPGCEGTVYGSFRPVGTEHGRLLVDSVKNGANSRSVIDTKGFEARPAGQQRSPA